MKKEYKKGDLTIVWQPDLCIHSGVCFHSLPSVFKPRERPWVQPDGAEASAVENAVRACPSGALSILSAQPVPDVLIQEKSKVKILPNGPVRVTGHCEVTLADGTVVEKPNGVSFCRCGGSANKPFCDGSHRTNGYLG